MTYVLLVTALASVISLGVVLYIAFQLYTEEKPDA